jgi:hypothetical protein
MASNIDTSGFAAELGRAGEKTACDGVRRSGEVAGVERESESDSSSLQCDDSDESESGEDSEVTGDDGGETWMAGVAATC